MQPMPTYIGKYELLGPLGHGGMGSVYKAFHPQLQRFVAIKVLLETAQDDPDFIARFQREAMAVAQLRHGHIVQVFDFDVEGMQPYMVMEYVEGETLAQRLSRLQREGQTLPIEEVVRYFQQLCSAVEYAHTRGMLHRDLKPQNVIINQQNEAILTDFGLAKIWGAATLTVTNAAVGTPHYMSPEQAQGQPTDARSDVYSLGVMLYLALAGKVPFDASAPVAVLMQHVTVSPPPIREINPQAPEKLAEVAMIAMAKDPDQRFRSAGAMAQAISEALNNGQISLSTPISSEIPPSTPTAITDSTLATILPTAILPASTQPKEPPETIQTDVLETITPTLPASPNAAQKQIKPAAGPVAPTVTPPLNGDGPPHTPVEAATSPTVLPPRAGKRRGGSLRWMIIGVIVLLLAITSSLLAFALVNQPKKEQAPPPVASVGTISFTDSSAQDFSHPANVLTGTFTGLAQPKGGATDFAWLCDSSASSCTLLGPVLVDQSGKASLTKTLTTNWLGAEDQQSTLTVKITSEETEPSAPPASPSTDVLYSGNLNPAVLLHIRHQLSAFTKVAPFQNNMTALDRGFGNDALLAQNIVQQLQGEQSQGDLASLNRKAGWLVYLIAGDTNGSPGPATGDDGFGMGTEAPACTSGLTTTYLPLLIEHACYASMAGGTPALHHLFTQIQQTGANASTAILAMQQMAQQAVKATNVQQVDIATMLQQAQQVLNDAYQIVAYSEQMATITLYPVR